MTQNKDADQERFSANNIGAIWLRWGYESGDEEKEELTLSRMCNDIDFSH